MLYSRHTEESLFKKREKNLYLIVVYLLMKKFNEQDTDSIFYKGMRKEPHILIVK